mgnify:CR=1 FL=1
METSLMNKKIEHIEKDLSNLKILMKVKTKAVSIKGLWKGIEVSEEELQEAKRSIFHKSHL